MAVRVKTLHTFLPLMVYSVTVADRVIKYKHLIELDIIKDDVYMTGFALYFLG